MVELRVICKFCKKTHQTEPQQFRAAFPDTWGRIDTPQTDLQSCTQKLIVTCQSVQKNLELLF